MLLTDARVVVPAGTDEAARRAPISPFSTTICASRR
jgi:hypothetical protein